MLRLFVFLEVLVTVASAMRPAGYRSESRRYLAWLPIALIVAFSGLF
jgi:hypothetical protein